MPIQLEIQIIIADEDRDKCLLMLKQATDDVLKYYVDNPTSSPPLNISHPELNIGEVNLSYAIV